MPDNTKWPIWIKRCVKWAPGIWFTICQTIICNSLLSSRFYLLFFFVYGRWCMAVCVRSMRMIANMPECMSSSNLDVDSAIKLRMDMVATGKGCSQCNAQMIRFGIRHVPSRRWIMKKISTGNILIIDILIICTICELLVPSILFLN